MAKWHYTCTQLLRDAETVKIKMANARLRNTLTLLGAFSLIYLDCPSVTVKGRLWEMTRV